MTRCGANIQKDDQSSTHYRRIPVALRSADRVNEQDAENALRGAEHHQNSNFVAVSRDPKSVANGWEALSAMVAP